MKTALITGGAGAVGSATARMLAGDGFAIVLADIAIEQATAVCDEVRADFGVDALALNADLSDLSSLGSMIATIGKRFGGLDCLVNNAGKTGAPKIGEVELDVWTSVITINLTAPMLLCQEALPLMRLAGGGSIVNVTSRVYLSGTGIGYTSSKAADRIDACARRTARQGWHPGQCRRPELPQLAVQQEDRGAECDDGYSFRKFTPLDRLGTPDDVAGAIAFLASDRASFITGDILLVCGGAQLAPQPV